MAISSQSRERTNNLELGKEKSLTILCRNFYWNRLVRTLPAYWVANLLALYPCMLGMNRHCAPPYATSDSKYASFLGTVLITFVPCNAWISMFGYPLDVPSWTISSLLGMWFLWPLHHHKIKAMSDNQLGTWTGLMLLL